MNVNLENIDLYEDDLFKTAAMFKKAPTERSKMFFEREISKFRSVGSSVSKKIDTSHAKGKEVTYVIAGEHVNKVVSFFSTELFSDPKKFQQELDNRLKAKLSAVADKNETINVNIVGHSVNLFKYKNSFENHVVVTGEFVSALKLSNFCIID